MRGLTVRNDGHGQVKTRIEEGTAGGPLLLQWDFGEGAVSDAVHIATPSEARKVADWLLRWADKADRR